MRHPNRLRLSAHIENSCSGKEATPEFGLASHSEAPASGLLPRVRRFHADEDGKITLISTVTMMFFLLLVCYVGNIGMGVKRKMELQNAADSAAYSTALWQARAMNAITVSNHMLGEATAVVVILESLGGRIQTEFGSNYSSQESANFNQQIDMWKETAPIYPPPLTQVDEKIIDLVAELITRDDGKHNAGATIYDSKMTLKHVFVLCLKLKTACTVGEVIGTIFPPLVFLQIACTAIDIAITSGPVLKVAQEWIFLEALEAAGLLMVPFHRSVEAVLIPAIAAYPLTLTGDSPLSVNIPGMGRDTPVTRATEKTLEDLGSFYQGQQITLHVAPGARFLKLPVIAEPAPKDNGTKEMPPSEWEGPFFTNPVLEALDDSFAAVDAVAGTAADIIDFTLGLISWIPGMDSGPVKKARDEIKKLTQALQRGPGPDYRRGWPENPCHHSQSNYKLSEFDWQKERTSQWVRATYPYVESFREPMIHWMQTGFSVFDLELSNAATWYTHWTNRYTLAKCWEIRSGESDAAMLVTPYMYIMDSSTAETKGREPWTTDSAAAEKMFVVYAVASREPSRSPFGSVLFPKAENEGSVAIAAAMFYNANGRGMPAQNGDSSRIQPGTGWDTLNWLPPFETHDWGNHQPNNENSEEIWNVFRDDLAANRGAQVQINWQAKLVPVIAEGSSATNFRNALTRSGPEMSGELKDQIRDALRRDTLINQ